MSPTLTGLRPFPDLANNRDSYYLRDAMGGHVGILFDHDDDPGTAGEAAFTVHDSFGNNMSKPLRPAGSYAWRGGEGSVTDSEPNLVHMQARHYDPTLGRFIQADSLMLASLTTQGMNRYIYTENDPVNRSDPTGQSFGDSAADYFFLMIGSIALAAVLLAFAPVLLPIAIFSAFAAGIFAGAFLEKAFPCAIDVVGQHLKGFIAGVLGFLLALALGALGVSFGWAALIGLALGLAIELFAQRGERAEPPDLNEINDDDSRFAAVRRYLRWHCLGVDPMRYSRCAYERYG